jgi:TolB-like protein
VLTALVLVAVALGASSQDLAAALGLGATETDVVVFPLRVRASPEYVYMGEVISEEIAADIGRRTLLRALEPDLLRQILDGAPSPREEQELGARLAARFWITGTVTQIGDSLIVRIVVQSESSIREAAFAIPARHQHPQLVARALVTRLLGPEIARRTELTRRLVP